METILIILLSIGAVYLAWRRRQRQRMGMMAGTSGPPDVQPPQGMPRIGRPGTITETQWEELEANRFAPQKEWSEEEAQAVLDALAYLRAAITQVTGQSDAPVEVQNDLLAFILSDDELREAVMRWGRGRALPLRESAVFQRVRERVMTHWDASEPAAG